MSEGGLLPTGVPGRRLLVVSGKGGVGKTCVASALSALAARDGLRVLLVSPDGRGDSAPLFGKADRGYSEVELAPSLRGLTADFDGLLSDFVHTAAPLALVADRILASSTFRYFTRATPGLPDLLLLGKIREVLGRKKGSRKAPLYDLVVLDAPATGHAISLLRIPRAILATTPAGPLRRIAGDLDRLLADPSASTLVVVAEPAELAAREAEELSEAAEREAGLGTALVVVNRVGRSGRTETLPDTSLPILRIPEIERPEEEDASKGNEGPKTGAAMAFFEEFLVAFEENAAAPQRGAGGRASASRSPRGLRAASPRSPSPSSLFPHPLDLAPWLDEARLVVLTGPGGVGKTTLAAAVGIAAARRGRRVLVLTVDPARRLAQALGLPENPERSARPTPVPLEGLPKGARLLALQIDPKATFERLLGRVAPPAALERIRRNRLYAGLVDSLPGVLEYMGVEALHEHASGGGNGLLVLDTPPAARGLDFLASPDRMVELLENDALRWFLRSDSLLSRALSGASRGAAAVLKLADNVLGFGFLSDLGDFFRAFDGLYDGFRDRSREISALLLSGRYLVVSSPDPSPLATSGEIATALKSRGASPALLLNRVRPGRPLPALPAPLDTLPARALGESDLPAAALPEALAALLA